MKKNILFLLLSVSMIFSGCDLLQIDPQSEITVDNYWKTESDVKGYVNGIYSKVRSINNTTLYGEDRGDAMVSGITGGVSRSHQHELNEQYGQDWKSFYEIIHHSNLVIKKVPEINFNSEKFKNEMLAQAYTFRAKTYLMLLQLWGEVPIILEPTESYDRDSRQARRPMEEVMSQILSDINFAIDTYPSKVTSDKNRLSRPAALCIKAEALAWKYTVMKSEDIQDLKDAINALEEVEKSGFSMMENYGEIFDADHRKNSEIIFSIYVRKDEMYNMYMSKLCMSGAGGLINDDLINKDQIPYSKSLNARHVYAPSPQLINSFSEKDKRANHVYIKAIDKNGKVRFISQNKFRGTVYEDRYYDDDMVIYRLGGVLLLKAELLAYLGDGASLTAAIDALSITRERAGLGKYTGKMEQKAILQEILAERGRELSFEQKRWPDLMRAHAAGTINAYEFIPNLKGKSTPLYFPITRQMIDLNPLLEQTKGY